MTPFRIVRRSDEVLVMAVSPPEASRSSRDLVSAHDSIAGNSFSWVTGPDLRWTHDYLSRSGELHRSRAVRRGVLVVDDPYDDSRPIEAQRRWFTETLSRPAPTVSIAYRVGDLAGGVR